MAKYWSFSPHFGVELHWQILGKQGPAPEEISQTLMTNRKPGDRASYQIQANKIRLHAILKKWRNIFQKTGILENFAGFLFRHWRMKQRPNPPNPYPENQLQYLKSKKKKNWFPSLFLVIWNNRKLSLKFGTRTNK
jgi:hypothetical protein